LARKVFFHTDSGEVFLKYIGDTKAPEIFHGEKRLSGKIIKKIKKPGTVDLFS